VWKTAAEFSLALKRQASEPIGDKLRISNRTLKDIVCAVPPKRRLTFRGILYVVGARSSVVVEALCYRPEGSGLETRWGHGILPNCQILLAALGPGVNSTSNRN
jgi:hypothetical protein